MILDTINIKCAKVPNGPATHWAKKALKIVFLYFFASYLTQNVQSSSKNSVMVGLGPDTTGFEPWHLMKNMCIIAIIIELK